MWDVLGLKPNPVEIIDKNYIIQKYKMLNSSLKYEPQNPHTKSITAFSKPLKKCTQNS
jgi:hypothetical protein